MQDFPSIPADIIGGLAQFKFARLDSVNSFEVLDSIVQLTDIASISASWYTGISTIAELKFSDELSTDQNGGSFNKSLTGFYPGDSATILALMQELANQYFILYIKDNDGLEKIVGSVNEPLVFSFKFDSANPRGKKGYAFTFTGSGRTKSPVWDPSLVQASSSASSSGSASV